MTWMFTDAGPGFIVPGSELPAANGVLALAFATDANTRADLAGQSLAVGFATTRSKLNNQWTAWAKASTLNPAGFSCNSVGRLV